jgi:hypothetical protein
MAGQLKRQAFLDIIDGINFFFIKIDAGKIHMNYEQIQQS